MSNTIPQIRHLRLRPTEDDDRIWRMRFSDPPSPGLTLYFWFDRRVRFDATMSGMFAEWDQRDPIMDDISSGTPVELMMVQGDEVSIMARGKYLNEAPPA